jgi:hypothetical protein
MSELKREAERQGLVASIGESTLWRWLTEDAIRPWQFRSWIFPRARDFAEKANRILDLYQRSWNGRPLKGNEYVISSDEKTSIQARDRVHPTTPPRRGASARVEHEYRRCGALAYLAAWDVHRGVVFGRCEKTTGIAPFARLVDQVMDQPPYRSASRVFWIVDNGSCHRGEKAAARLQQWPNAILANTPCHASWLNQVEIYFSVLQRKVLTPNDSANLSQLEDHPRLRAALHGNRQALPVEVHSPRPQPAPRKPRSNSTPARRLKKYVTEYAGQSTKPRQRRP